ncbi:MAG: type II toxin-antitoxin system VapC family toxin [Gammaproteobacteria bacterium]|nr:type II toxin-antitoxin system VapC family toxin [Gammaproteobacteria bacterium]
MKVLLDTCVLSASRHPVDAIIVQRSLQDIEANDLFLSVISMGEITKGISLLPPSKKREELHRWALHVEQVYADRLLTITHDIAHSWGELTANAQLKGITIPVSDGLIAATALAHGLHLMTRNTVDFKATGVLLVNPWAL